MTKADSSATVLEHCPVAHVTALAGEHRCEACNTRMQSVCSALELTELSEVEHLSKPLCFPPKSTLLREGQSRDAVFTITSGMVRLSRTLPEGQRQIVGFAIPGDFLGLDLSDEVDFSAETITQVNACRYSRKEFAEFLNAKPQLMKRLHELTAHELHHAQDHMVVLGVKNAEGKVAAFLINLRDRFAKLEHVVVNVPLAMTRQDIGDYLGLTVETVSRTITKFAREKLLVVTPDGVRLLNAEKLRLLGEL